MWRVTHPDRLRVRLAKRSLDAWRRLEVDTGLRALLFRGLMWRDDATHDQVVAALKAEDVPHTVVDPDDVGRFFPGLRPDGRKGIWQESAGPVLASSALDAQVSLFARSGGRLSIGPVIREVETTGDAVRLTDAAGRRYDADVAILAPGPGAGALLSSMGIDIAFRPLLEQVCHVDDAARTDHLPCLYDGPIGDEPGMYAMPTPGRGYKLGIAQPLRPWLEIDHDRVPDPAVSAVISARVRRNFLHLDAAVRDAQVCSWTDSPDGRFVIDTLAGGRVVLACGDSGEGFKFSALFGPLLADLTEGGAIDPDLASFGLARFAAGGEAVEDSGGVGR